MAADKKNTATKLVEIAEELFTFACVTEGRQRAGDPEPIRHTYASPKNNPDVKRPLADKRRALGDAMTVLEGKARKAAPIEADATTLGALLGGGMSSIATQLVEMAHERFTFGVTTTGEVFAVPVDGPNVARVLCGGRRSLRSELARIFFERPRPRRTRTHLRTRCLSSRVRPNGSTQPRWRYGSADRHEMTAGWCLTSVATMGGPW